MVKLNIEGLIGQLSAAEIAEGKKSFSSFDMQAWLDKNKAAKEVQIDINSNGGSVTHGYAIRNMLINSGKVIHTVGHNVKSIATVIFNLGVTRKVFNTTEFLPHNPWLSPAVLGDTAMEAADYAAIADDLQNEQNKLLDTYAIDLKLTPEKKSQLAAVMDKNQNMPIADVLAFGFATEIADESAVSNYGNAVVYSELIMAKLNTNKMKDNKEAKSAMQKVKDFLAKALKDLGSDDKKNASTKLKDGTTEIFHDGELKEGVAVFTDPEMTAKVEGDVTLEDGTVVAVTDGVVTGITAPDNSTEAKLTEENNALKDRNKTLLEEAKAKDTEIANLKEQNKNALANITELSNSITEMESKYFAPEKNDGKEKPDAQNFAKDQGKKENHPLTFLQRNAAKQFK